MEKIKLYIESKNGHDEIDVPKGQLQGEVEKQLNDNKWVTLENKDGTTEILTKKDLPQEEKKEDWKSTFQTPAPTSSNGQSSPAPAKPVPQASQVKTFAKKFEKVVSATATHKIKGG
ncbi:MAG: hypothetical protein ABII22_04525 [Candidatus Micrarchaeota archaeon]